jgi:hypothetical protein
MRTLHNRLCVALLAALLWQPVGAALNYAPRPAVYTVIMVEPGGRSLRLRAADGRTGSIDVAQEVFDLSTLKPGDKIRVDFAKPDGTSKRLRAVSIWPEK